MEVVFVDGDITEHIGSFGMYVDVCIMDIGPSATLGKVFGADMRGLNPGCKKCEKLATNVFRSGGASL